ncbi:hypothetical protein [Macrococcoides caseolyticum]|uniref:hypothetical protein n=1 Tax=Macrococcoides caseolyticum TaxID=69966 RepID=UPI000C334F73|nr:hypothetical protein [Macrococcus caseolyticus]PKE18689.1 hypothetical protein CW679_09800 [Macrococcus caseolyticus]PKF41661.1 hypothetical protein CW661_00565 [Macrococcus caseolyticus]
MLIDDLLEVLRDLCKENRDNKMMFDYWASLGITAKKMIEEGEFTELDEYTEEVITKIENRRNEEYDNE